jgi:ankyrin repeat protein
MERSELDVNSKDRQGQTPLYYAARREHIDVVSELLKRKDSGMNSGDELGQSSLHYVVWEGYVGEAYDRAGNSYGLSTFGEVSTRRKVTLVTELLKQDGLNASAENAYRKSESRRVVT